MENNHIVKWQVQDMAGNWVYRYLGGFTITRESFDYDTHIFKEGCLKYPEAVAEWLCTLLERHGLNPEMEKV